MGIFRIVPSYSSRRRGTRRRLRNQLFANEACMSRLEDTRGHSRDPAQALYASVLTTYATVNAIQFTRRWSRSAVSCYTYNVLPMHFANTRRNFSLRNNVKPFIYPPVLISKSISKFRSSRYIICERKRLDVVRK